MVIKGIVMNVCTLIFVDKHLNKKCFEEISTKGVSWKYVNKGHWWYYKLILMQESGIIYVLYVGV